MSRSIYTSQSSDYGYSAHYSTSSTEEHNPQVDGILSPGAADVPGRSFTIEGISTASAFILEVFLSAVHCVKGNAFQNDPSNEGGRGGTLDVRKGVFDNQAVALKRIRPDKLTSTQYERSLADVLFELRALSHRPFANHRNIPTLLGFSLEHAHHDDDTGPTGATMIRPVLLMEWATIDLNRYFLASQEQSPMDCAELVADIADGLQAMHLYGLSHADLKPENVLLYPDSSSCSSSGFIAKLSDFGFSGSEQHEMPDGGDTPAWGAPGREYGIADTECPGDVFSFGLVAIFAALRGHWDARLYGKGVGDVERRQANLRDALLARFVNETQCGSATIAADNCQWFARWDDLLSRTVTPKAESRLSTSELGKVRQSLTGQDPFRDQRRAFADQVQPFRGSKGAKTERFAYLMWTRTGALNSDPKSFNNHASNITAMLPAGVKQAIVDDINTLDLSPRAVLRMRDATSARVVAILFLRLLMAADSGGLFVPGETRASSHLDNLNVSLMTGLLWYQTLQAGTRLGGDAREKRPRAWQLAEQEMTGEAVALLETDPALIRHLHRGYTIAHHACLLGNPELLSAVLRLDGAAAGLMSHFGVTPLVCAMASDSRGGSECLRLLLLCPNSDVGHVAANGLTVLEHAYMTLLSNYFENPVRQVPIRAFLGLLALKDRVAARFLGDADPQKYLRGILSEEQFKEALPKIEIGLRRRRYLGDALYDTMYERLEILRRHIGPCDSMHSIYAGLFMTLCVAESTLHLICTLLCAALLFCVVASWVIRLASGTWWELLGGLLSIRAYQLTVVGIMRAAAAGRDPSFADRCTSSHGTVAIDLMTRDGGLLGLLPMCMYVSHRRRDRSWNRALAELEWMRASFGIPGSVYDPSGFSMAEMRRDHPLVHTARTLGLSLLLTRHQKTPHPPSPAGVTPLPLLTKLHEWALSAAQQLLPMAHTLHTSDTIRWLAVSRRDTAANSSFFYGAVSTRIFCRPTCPGRVARRSNVVFFDDRDQAAGAGYRPCRRCQPCSETWTRGSEGAALARCLRDMIAAAEEGGTAWTVEGFARGLGVSGAHLHREFKKHCGLTPRSFGASLRSGSFTDGGQKERARSAGVSRQDLEVIDGDTTPHSTEQLESSNTAVGPASSGEVDTGPFSTEDFSLGFLDISALEEFLCFDDS